LNAELDLGAVPNASTISPFGLEWIYDGGDRDRQAGIDESRTTDWQRYSPNTIDANDNVSYGDYALAA